MHIPGRLLLGIGVIALCSFAFVACGDDDDDVDDEQGTPIVTVTDNTPGLTPSPDPTEINENDTTIEIGDDFFEPEDISIDAGTRVIWEWTGENDHRVDIEYQGEEALSDEQSEGTYEFTFDQPGEYDYHCTVHGPEIMSGTIVVREAGS